MFLHLTFPYENKFYGEKKNKFAMEGEDHANVYNYDSFVTEVYAACRVNR